MDKYLNVMYFAIIFMSLLPFLKRLGFKRVLEYGALWMLIFLLLGIFYMFKEELEPYSDKFIGELIPGYLHNEGGYIVINQSIDGHYYLNLSINGHKHKALVDTGASEVMIPSSFAALSGVEISNYSKTFQTANGLADARKARANIIIGEVVFQDFPIYVQSVEQNMFLVGMSFLQRFSEFKFEANKLYLKP